MIQPKNLSIALRRVAARVDNSRNPSRQRIIAALRSIVAGLDEDDAFLKMMPDAVEDELRRPQKIVTQWGGDDIEYMISFPNVNTIEGYNPGDMVDMIVELSPSQTNPMQVRPLTLKLQGQWDAYGQVPAKVVSGQLPAGTDKAFIDYLTVHINSLISNAWDAAAEKINTELDTF